MKHTGHLMVLVGLGMCCASAGLSQGFEEHFTNSTFSALDPAWQLIDGLGTGSLTDNPGHLRVHMQGPRAHAEGWMADTPHSSWTPSDCLVRQFEGKYWVLRAKARYRLRYPGTGSQVSKMYIAFSDDIHVQFYRGCDEWYSVNHLRAHITENGVELAGGDHFISVYDTVTDGWLDYTYWFEIVRNDQTLSLNYSTNGISFQQAASATFTAELSVTQKLAIGSTVWTTAGSYADFDYITLEDTSAEPFSHFIPAETMIKYGRQAGSDRALMVGLFELGADSDGIDPLTEDVSLAVGGRVLEIQPGSFELVRTGRYEYSATLGQARLLCILSSFGDGLYAYRVDLKNCDLSGTANPTRLKLAIGDDERQATVRLRGTLHRSLRPK